MTDEMTEACRQGLNNHYLILNHQGAKKLSVLYVFVDLRQPYKKNILGHLRPTLSLGTVINLLKEARKILDQGKRLFNMDAEYSNPALVLRRKPNADEIHEVDGIFHVLHAFDAAKTHYGPLIPLLLAKAEGDFITFLEKGIGHNRTKPAKH